MNPEVAFFRFHLRVGARLAVRILAPVLASTLFLFYLLRPEFVIELARILFLEGSLVESGLIGTLLLLGLARTVAPRITAGGAGWARSLPADGRVLRALEVLSLVVAEAPLLSVLGALAWAVAGPSPGRIALRLAGLIVGASASGLIYIRNPHALKRKLLPFASCFLSFSGNAVILGASAALFILALASPADLNSRRRQRPRRSLPSAAFFFGLSIRAVGVRIILAYIPPAIVLAAARLFLANNELTADRAFSISLFGLVLGLAVYIGLTAGALAARRPAWPWLRSLPRSSAARVNSDALLLAVHALPVAAGLALLGRPAWEAVFLAGPLAWFSFRGAGAVREAGDRPFGVLGQVFVEGTIMSLIIALLSWTSWVLLLAAPVAFHFARSAERRLKPTRWAERHHSNAGDPLSWSAT